jgi:hypothetical protein
MAIYEVQPGDSCQEPSLEMQECVRRFADARHFHHTCPNECRRCAFERLGALLLVEWERESGR